MKIKSSLVLAILSWGTLLILGWLMILGIVKPANSTWAMFFVWLIVACFASAIYDRKPMESGRFHDIEVNYNGKIYKGDNVITHVTSNKIFVWIDDSPKPVLEHPVTIGDKGNKK